MATVTFAAAFTRWLSGAATSGGSAAEHALQVSGKSVRSLLEAAFTLHPRLRHYVLDERGALRHHVVVFVDGVALKDKHTQSEQVGDETQVYVMQALSGG